MRIIVMFPPDTRPDMALSAKAIPQIGSVLTFGDNHDTQWMVEGVEHSFLGSTSSHQIFVIVKEAK